MRCQLCGEDKKLIKAHIIPQCLYTPLKNPSGPIMQVFKTPDTPPRRTPTGEYDTGILCADCDNHKLGCFDRYAGELLLKNLDVNTTKKYYVVQEYSYSSLKLFFLSVLWRMSVSTLPSVKKVKLGPFEAQIRDMLLRKDAGPPETFPIVLHRYIDLPCCVLPFQASV